MCGLDDDVNEEATANAFAANFLMPKCRVDKVTSNISGTAFEQAKAIAEALKVSILAAGVRLRTLHLISDEDLESIRLESDRRWAHVRESRKSSAEALRHGGLATGDLGSGYVGTIARALEDKRVDLLDASYLLNARVPMVKQMIDEYHKTEGLE